MSNKIYKIFEDVEVKAKLLAKYWNNFYTEISEHLPDTYQPEMQELYFWNFSAFQRTLAISPQFIAGRESDTKLGF